MKRLVIAIVALAAAFLASAAFAARTMDNGSFETGDFSGWVTKGGPAVDWEVYSSTDPIAAPSPVRGKYAATVDEDDSSTPILLQRFTVPKHAKLTLWSAYINLADRFATPHELDAAGDMHDNQQYRIDVMRGSAPSRSLDSQDVLMNIFRTKVGDPLESEPGKITTDLSKLAGKKVYLRFVTADNLNPLNIFVDGVKVTTSR